MAECSYARCLQERRLIKRELMKWSKDMLHIVGLERIAEELMGRRKWKHYHEALTRTHLTNTEELTATIEHLNIDAQSIIKGASAPVEHINGVNHQQQQQQDQQPKTHHNNNQQTLAFEDCVAHVLGNGKEASDEQDISDKVNATTTTSQDHQNSLENHKEYTHCKTNGNITNNQCNSSSDSHHNDECRAVRTTKTPTTTEIEAAAATPPLSDPIDWKPNEKCNFCVNGKLLTVNAKGELVAESGPTASETDHVSHNNSNKLESDSDSDESSTVDHNHINNNNNNSIQNNNTSSRLLLNKLLATQLRSNSTTANMTSMDSMAAIAAFQNIEQYYPNINWLHLAQQQQQQQQQPTHPTNSDTPTTSETSAAAVSPHLLKESPSPSDATGEQPLDLSSKPSPNSSISGDLKAARTKSPRATPVPGRRPYSDEDLNKALQEIMSGRVGTRKASVQYNVPRSTLRNKVNKLNNPLGSLDLLQLHHDRELSDDGGDDDGDDDRENDTHTSHTSTPQPPAEPQPTTLEDLAKRMAATATLRKMCESNGSAEMAANPSPKPDGRQSGTPVSLSGVPQPQTSPQPSTPLGGPLLTDASAVLETLLRFGAYQLKLDQTVTFRDLINAILLNMKDSFGATTSGAAQPSTAEALLATTTTTTAADTKTLLDPRLLLQQLQYQSQQRLLKSETPETASSLDPSEMMCGDEGSPTTILKIPSVKLVSGTAGGSGPMAGVDARASMSPALLGSSTNSLNNACQRSVDSPNSSSMLAAAVTGNNAGSSKSRNINNNNNISPSLLHSASQMETTQLPSSYNIRDVMANSIHQKMAEQANQEVADLLGVNLKTEHGSNGSNYKKPSISVVKNIGGTDTSRFGAAPNLLANSHHHHHHQHQPVGHLQHAHQPPHLHHHHHHSPPHHHLSRQEAAALAAGKGTRPKRGKYRNYDRDSLVEAVKAVQRGEMSVHRAGSYYGVPHSTLEYKVKERHLMRPRKREPKPQPGLDGSGSSSSKANTSHIPGQNDKTRRETNSASSSSSNSKLSNALKNNTASAAAAFPNAVTANGMKLPMYDAAAAAAYSQLFWPNSSAFNQLQMGLSRNVGGSGASTSAPNDLISSHIQRYQEEAMRAAGIGSSNNATSASSAVGTNPTGRGSSISLSPITSPLAGQNHHLHHPHQMALNIKSAREMADNFYDSGEPNGSAILDGVIRTTLNRKSEGIPTTGNAGVGVAVGGGALLDQLLVKKTPMPFTNNRANDYASTSHIGAAGKRHGSPLNYSEIKRERSSPPHSSENDDNDGDDDDEEDASRSACDTTEDSYEHNNNNNNNNNSSSNNKPPASQLQQIRNSRMTSNDSEDSSLQSDFHGKPSHTTSMPLANIPDISNGGSNSAMATQQPSQVVKSDTDSVKNNNNGTAMTVTSILQDKLVQIKAEQEQDQGNL